jgi:8-oxo-dGTP diphosphatase
LAGIAVGTVLMTLHEGRLQTLALHRPSQGWHLPFGTVGVREPLRQAAERVVAEQLGAQVDYLEQLYTFGNIVPAQGERQIQVCYYGLVPKGIVEAGGTANKPELAWLSETELGRLPVLEQKIVERAHSRLRGKLAYTAVGFELLPESFTLAELQQLYETILGKRLDKRNFRRRILELGILAPTGEERARARGRPAALYSFKAEVFHSLESRGDILAF